MKTLNFSEDFHVYRYANGIKLVTPEFHLTQKNNQYIDTRHTIKSMANLPLSSYLLNRNSSLAYATPISLNLWGLDSLKPLLGKTADEVFPNKSNKVVINHDQNVMQANHFIYFDEQVILTDKSITDVISLKFPVYDQVDQIIGLFGCSIRIENTDLVKSFSIMSDLNLLNVIPSNDRLKSLNKKTYFTKREFEIMSYLVKGKTAQNIGDILCISRRTVESHIDHIKNKLNVSTRSQLIEKIYPLCI